MFRVRLYLGLLVNPISWPQRLSRCSSWASRLASPQAVRDLTPHHMAAPFTLVVLVFAIVTKELLFRHVITVGAEVGSLAVANDAWHHRSDAITSLDSADPMIGDSEPEPR